MADRGRLTANLTAVGLLVAVAGALLLWQQPWNSSRGSQDDDLPPIPADARVLLARQFSRLSSATTKVEFVRAAGDSGRSRAFASAAWDARRRLGVTGVRLRYDRGGAVADRSDGTTSAQVSVTWRTSAGSVLGQLEPMHSQVRIRLAPRATGFDVVSATSTRGHPLPLWLAGAIDVHRSGPVTTIAVDGGVPALHAESLARKAVDAVQAFLPVASERVVVIVPHTTESTTAILGRAAKDVEQIAAISTPLVPPTQASAIVLNPAQFASMAPRSRQVVMTHEATHLLTGVIGRHPELWVVEGFADYVALRHDRSPLAVSAGQILRQVRAHGAPRRLPSAADFAETAHGLSTVYESAWMVFRMLGERFGDDAVIGLYRDVLNGTPTAVAVRNHLGVSVPDLTAAWRAYLTKSASTMS